MTKKTQGMKDIKRIFLALEEELQLFNKKLDGIYFWEYLRIPIFVKLLKELGYTREAHTTTKKNFRNMSIMSLWALRNIVLKNPFLTGKKDILIFGGQRKKLDENGLYTDIYGDQLIESLDSGGISVQALDVFYEGGHSEPVRNKRLKYLDFLTMFGFLKSIVSKTRLTSEEIGLIERIEKRFKREFGVNLDFRKEILYWLSIRKRTLWSMEKVLGWYEPKLVVDSDAGGTQDMILAEICKRKKIPFVQLQHGVMGPYHMAFNFPKVDRQLSTLPDYVFIFGDYWADCTEIPLPDERIISTGFPYFEHEAHLHKGAAKKKGQILFISGGDIGRDLSKFAIEFARKTGKQFKIIYKLHPGEYARWKAEYPWLIDSGLQIIDNDRIPLYALLSTSEAQVGVGSTAIYEGLFFGLRTYIVELLGWEYMEGLIDNGLAIKVKNAGELSSKIKDSEARGKPTADKNYFFKENALENQVNEILKILKDTQEA